MKLTQKNAKFRTWIMQLEHKQIRVTQLRFHHITEIWGQLMDNQFALPVTCNENWDNGFEKHCLAEFLLMFSLFLFPCYILHGKEMMFAPKKGNPLWGECNRLLSSNLLKDRFHMDAYNFVPLKGGCHWLLLAHQ